MGKYFEVKKNPDLIDRTVIDAIRQEIENVQRDILGADDSPSSPTFSISVGLSMALGIIDKHVKGENNFD